MPRNCELQRIDAVFVSINIPTLQFSSVEVDLFMVPQNTMKFKGHAHRPAASEGGSQPAVFSGQVTPRNHFARLRDTPSTGRSNSGRLQLQTLHNLGTLTQRRTYASNLPSLAVCPLCAKEPDPDVKKDSRAVILIAPMGEGKKLDITHRSMTPSAAPMVAGVSSVSLRISDPAPDSHGIFSSSRIRFLMVENRCNATTGFVGRC